MDKNGTENLLPISRQEQFGGNANAEKNRVHLINTNDPLFYHQQMNEMSQVVRSGGE